jgi:hypothetical protein
VSLSPTAAERPRRRRRRWLLLLLLLISVIPSVVTTTISIGLFADGAIIEDAAWAPAPVQIRAEPSLIIGITDMLPGDERHAQIVIENLGADAVRYSIAVASTNDDGKRLRESLVLRVSAADPSCAEATADRLIFEGSLATASVGDPAAGGQPGDRALEPAGRETVCVTVLLPAESSNAVQAAETTVTFAINAEHMGIDR